MLGGSENDLIRNAKRAIFFAYRMIEILALIECRATKMSRRFQQIKFIYIQFETLPKIHMNQ